MVRHAQTWNRRHASPVAGPDTRASAGHLTTARRSLPADVDVRALDGAGLLLLMGPDTCNHFQRTAHHGNRRLDRAADAKVSH